MAPTQWNDCAQSSVSGVCFSSSHERFHRNETNFVDIHATFSSLKSAYYFFHMKDSSERTPI